MKITFSDLRQMVREHLYDDPIQNASELPDVRFLKNEPLLPADADSLDENFEVVNEHTLLREAEQKIEELKTISEEIRRMKQLVDFRSPLLGKENS